MDEKHGWKWRENVDGKHDKQKFESQQDENQEFRYPMEQYHQMQSNGGEMVFKQ